MIHVDTNEASNRLGLSARTLERWRLDGTGPSFRKFGSRVLYSLEDLDDWAARQQYVPNHRCTTPID